jgi:hypothetical protein
MVYLFPPLSIVALHAYRFSAVVVLCLAICVSRAARVPWWGGLILLEVLFLSPVPYPAHYIEAQPSVALQELQKASEGAVLSAPLAMENLHDLSQALVAQTQHQKPIQDGGIHRRIGSEAKQLFVQNALVSAMSHRDGPVLIEGTAAQKAADELCGLGYRFFLLKRGDKEMEKWAKKWMGEARVQDERWSWWIFPNCINKENP